MVIDLGACAWCWHLGLGSWIRLESMDGGGKIGVGKVNAISGYEEESRWDCIYKRSIFDFVCRP